MTYAEMAQKQSLPYESKILLAKKRIEQFDIECERRGLNTHISVGGLDSITLLMFLRSLGYSSSHVPAVSVSILEDKSIQAIHRQLRVECIKPLKSMIQVTQEFGYPIISKDVARGVSVIQNPTPKNAVMRHAIMTGETGPKNGYKKSPRMKLSQKWLDIFGGPENDTYGTDYQTCPFKVSDKCCHYMKEKPLDDWAKEHNSIPYIGLMASEGGRRAKALTAHGCNYFGVTTTRSCPFAIFTRQDLLQLALDLKVPVPEIYGSIERKEDSTLYTTKAQRTGCVMCGFGIHMEKRPHRFDRLREEDPKQWEFWMYNQGWGEVLSYIGVGWEDEPPKTKEDSA